jgi:hypothetical protein
MLELLFPTAVGLVETQRCCEDWATSLPRLDSPCDVASTVADSFDVIDNGNFRIAGKNKVAVHAVNGKVGRDGSHRRGKTLGDCGAAIDSAGSWRMPEGASVGKDILSDIPRVRDIRQKAEKELRKRTNRPDVIHRSQLKDIFDRRLGGVELRRLKQCHALRHFVLVRSCRSNAELREITEQGLGVCK